MVSIELGRILQGLSMATRKRGWRRGSCGRGAVLAKLFLAVGSVISLLLAPDHQLVDQSLWLVTRDMGKSKQELVKSRVGSGATDLLN